MALLAIGIEYQGTAYCGWQRQAHCDSVQQPLEAALSEIANEPIELNCAGRTDTGVHAIGQVAHFVTTAERPDKAWVQGVNTKLPRDIRVIWVKPMTGDFHARFSAVARQYRYVIFNRSVHSAILAHRVTWESWPLDETKMHQAAQALIGERDFSSFRAAGCQAAHARREVQWIAVSRRGDFVFVDIRANAFLHHMVRNIVGTLLEVGRGEKPVDWVTDLLAKQDRTQAGMTAPADGLYFVNAFYPEAFELPQVELNELLWQGG
ncbi:MAG: tRNA pseudouridine(38-40) synthase TruA [Hydrogenovibrio sp.]